MIKLEKMPVALSEFIQWAAEKEYHNAMGGSNHYCVDTATASFIYGVSEVELRQKINSVNIFGARK